MKRSFLGWSWLFALTLAISCSQAPNTPSTSMKEETRSLYLHQDFYTEFKNQIADFPKPGSIEQKTDEKQLQLWQKKRTSEDCKRASTEVVVTLQNFYGLPYGTLTEMQIQKLQPLFKQVHREGGPYIGQIKNGYTRQRPYIYVKQLEPCVSKESSYAYPSGHSTLAVLYALVLKDLFPEQEQTLKKRSDQIALDRVIGGVHHPTDIEAGKKLGLVIYNEMQKSQAYQDDIQKYKKLLL